VRFVKLWPVIGKKFAEDVPSSLGPMLADCCGVILDVGPGAGNQLVHLKRPENITAVYGAEPGVDLHAALRKNATKVVLGEKYRVLPCGVEMESLIPALAKVGLLGDEGGLGNGVFDEVVCIRVLCGVPKQRETIERLYWYLKPGRRFVVGEHVVNDESELGSWVARLFQLFWMALGWPFWGGGCEPTRDMRGVLMKAAEPDGG
jgi:SAM-dependent methyltransferase